MVTAGELGNLLIGPWETLSLLYTFRPNGGKDFHRAIDYFSPVTAQFPKPADVGSQALKDIDKEHVPAVHSGRVNLNAPHTVICTDEDAMMGVTNSLYNVEPLAAVLTGAAVNEGAETALTYNQACDVADAFYAETDLDEDSTAGNAIMVRKLSDLGNIDEAGKESPVLRTLMADRASLKIYSDADREGVIRNSIAGITTRGQTYLVILRADAYSPKYGSTSAGDGTTLASTHAIVELWRDSEPARTPDGRLFPIGTTTPTHSWYVRSVRWF